MSVQSKVKSQRNDLNNAILDSLMLLVAMFAVVYVSGHVLAAHLLGRF